MAARGLLLSLARVQTKRHRRAVLNDLVSYFQQLSTMLNAGTPLLHALRLCSDQTASQELARIGKDIANRVAGGDPFHQAAQAYPDVFRVHWIQMIRTGEVTGQLGPLMRTLSESILKSQATRNQVQSALIYPFILLGVAAASLFIMLWKVVPTFAEFFQDFGTTLPPITQVTITLSNVFKDYGVFILLALGGLGFLLRRYFRTEAGNTQIRSLLMATPMLGDIYVQAAMEKFASNLSILLKSGIPLLEALRTTQEIFRDDPVYHGSLGSIYNYVARGSTLAGALEIAGLFTPMVQSMARVGEESGKLADVLEVAAQYYRERVETMIGRFTQTLEPVIVIGMGVIVAGLLASIYIPMFQLAAGPR